jgi:lon-related putative ATP-dependent protease
MTDVQPLTPDKLFKRCDPKLFEFETTADLDDLKDIIGQPRAVEAVRFGIGIAQEGYNIYALGPVGVGKKSLVTKYFENRAKTEPIPSDWCYVHNFEHNHKPNAISLPAGLGSQFQKDMEQLVEELRTAISSAFESDEYRARRQAIEEEFQEQQEADLEELREHAKEHGLTLLRTPGGLVFAPTKDDQVLSPDDFQKLPEDERKRLESNVEELQEQLQKVLQRVPSWQRDLRSRIKKLNREVTSLAVGDLISEIRQKYQDHPEVLAYLEEVENDVVENARDFLPGDEGQAGGFDNPLAALMARARQEPSPLVRYQVNLVVDNQDLDGAPVIYEDNPSYQNLIGRVDHIAQMGALTTDFRMIKPGALHNANGGYLVLDVRKVLQQPYAYEALKRSLQSEKVTIESLGQMLSLISTVSLEPEPIPLDVKVALLGDRMLYYLLNSLDPDFNELFKVQADFEEQMDRTPANQELYAQLISTMVRKNELRALDREAVARVIDHSARLVGDCEKLSTQFNEIVDLLREADYWAGENGNDFVKVADIQKAIDAHIYRADRVRERMQESILRDTILVDTQGAKVGQVNGLSVIMLGNFSFGRPNRITARVRMGKGEVINIEREVELSGPIHSKGVLILAGFLGARYAADKPLSLTASLVFEQSYSGVEGDSASSAELYALLSGIAEVPIKQSFAVTGSVNQHGQIQAIGGVNEKIEGFFDICKRRGLTGDQGVLIPASNVKNLILRQDVIDAVEAGQFRIYPIESVDQGIEILTAMPAGEQDEEGNYPQDTINGRVQARLIELAEARGDFGRLSREDNAS